MQPQINFLSKEEVEQLHQAALWLLNNVGMQMPSDKALKIMKKAGAKVEGKNIVKIQPELVDYALEKVPKRDGFVLYGREQKHDIHFGMHTPVLASMAAATHVIDLETKERRPCTTKDLIDIVLLMDALENVSISGTLATPQDVPKDIAEWYGLATVLKNTSKHIITATMGSQFVRDAVRMASLTVGGEEQFRQRPFVSFVVLTRSPFQIDRLSLEGLIEVSQQGLQVGICSGPIMGATSPVTLAGTVAQVHAETLAALVLCQLVRPGTQFSCQSFARSMDMKTASTCMASPEFSILRGALGQMGRYLDLPVMMPAFLRDAKIMDAQAGFETGVVGLIATLAADVIIGLQYDMDTLVDFADLVFCNEALSALKRIAKGFTISQDTLALDVIKEVGHGGNFLGMTHTVQNFRKEIWIPYIMERNPWAQWYEDGHKDIEQKAREKAKAILASYQSERLTAEVEAEIDRIASEAQIDYTQSI